MVSFFDSVVGKVLNFHQVDYWSVMVKPKKPKKPKTFKSQVFFPSFGGQKFLVDIIVIKMGRSKSVKIRTRIVERKRMVLIQHLPYRIVVGGIRKMMKMWWIQKYFQTNGGWICYCCSVKWTSIAHPFASVYIYFTLLYLTILYYLFCAFYILYDSYREIKIFII